MKNERENRQKSFYSGGIMNTKRNLLIAGIAATVLIAVIALVIALKPVRNTGETPVTPKVTEVPADMVVYTVKYSYELDETVNTETAEVSRPKERLTWSVSDIPETEIPGLYVVSAEITVSNLPGWTVTWNEDSLYPIWMGQGEYTILYDGEKVADTYTSYGALHFTDLNGDGLPEFCDVQRETIMVYDFGSQMRSDMSRDEDLTYEWFEGTDEDVVIRTTRKKGYKFAQRGRIVIAGETLEFQEITNPTSTDSVEVMPSARNPVECWFDSAKGDEETRRLLRLEEDGEDESMCVYVVDKGRFYYYYPVPGEWPLKRYTDAGIFPVCSGRRFLNAYVTDLDGDGCSEFCMTFQHPMDHTYRGAVALLISGNRKQVIDQSGYDLRFVEEDGRLVVKRKPIGGTKEETLSLEKTEYDRFELAEP